jgi:hypothetical protein
MRKMTMSARLDPDLIARLQTASKTIDASINHTISLALDALEREQKGGNSVAVRVGFLEKNLSAMLDLVTAFGEKIDEKFSQANINERERLKSLYKLLNTKMCEHDEAEEARFSKFVASIRGGTPQ